MRTDAPWRTIFWWDKIRRNQSLTQSAHVGLYPWKYTWQWNHSWVSKSTEIKVQKCRPTCSMSRLPISSKETARRTTSSWCAAWVHKTAWATDIYTHLQSPALHCLQRRCEAAPTAPRLDWWVRRHAYVILIGSLDPCGVQELNVQYPPFQMNTSHELNNLLTVNEMINQNQYL